MKTKAKNHKEIDTSLEGYSYIGIKLSQEQLSDLAYINIMMQSGAFDEIPVHAILLVMKTLGLLPTQMIDDKCSDNTSNNTGNSSNNNILDGFRRKFGRLIN